MLTLIALALLPIVAVTALLAVDRKRVVLKRTLFVLAILSPTPAAWALSAYVTRFQQSACYTDVLGHVQALSLEYSKIYGTKAPEELEKAIGPFMRGYETDCAEALQGVRKLRSAHLPPGAELP